MRYDAFISYRHGELDSIVAEKLHKLLETYRVPRPIAEKIGRKKLGRIFRDREELPTSSNLSNSINDALENSSFLLLICSRRTCQSQWVMREIEHFGELHGKDKIITLLIDGEPDESFPPGLREREADGEIVFVEPLAADIRAETRAQSLKLLKEEKLRLLAPILGVAFDDLRRRHFRRKVQQIIAGISVALAISLSFGAFSTWQYLQIEKQMQLKLQNQSYVLAEYSKEALENGDPDTAALLAVEALPKNLQKPERPLVPAAERALADALMVYNTKEGFNPHKTVVLPAAPSKILLSPDESYAALLCPYNLVLVNLQNGEIIATLPTSRLALADMEFISNSIVLYTGENGLVAYDIAVANELWATNRPATTIAISGNGEKIATVCGNAASAFLFDSTGKELGEISFAGRKMKVPVENSLLNPHDSIFELNETGAALAVSFSEGSLLLFNTASGADTIVYSESSAIHFAGGFYKNYLAYAVVENSPYTARYSVYDTVNANTIGTSSATSQFIPLICEDGLYFATNDQIIAFNPVTGQVAHVASAGGNITAWRKSGENLLVCEASGRYSFIGSKLQNYQSEYICNFADLGDRYALTGSYDSKSVRILRKAELSGNEVFEYDNSYYFYEARIHRGIERIAFYSHEGLRLCDLQGKIIAEAGFIDPMLVKDTQYNTESGNVTVIYKDVLRIYSGKDASLLLEVQGKKDVDSVFYSGLGVSILLETGEVVLYDLATLEAVITANVAENAVRALPTATKLINVREAGVFADETLLGAGTLIGAGKGAANDEILFAISDGMGGKVFSLKNSAVNELLSFNTVGYSEAYFCDEYVFVSSLQGNSIAYSLKDGSQIREFAETGYMTEVLPLGENIIANYIAANSKERYSFLLDKHTLEPIAYLPGFLGEIDDGKLVLDSGSSLQAVDLLDTSALIKIAEERLAGRELTEKEKQRYNIG